MSGTEMQVSYFGGRENPLFGCYHPASPETARETSALLCPPMGQEQIRSHLTLRQLALTLSAAGVPTLRFDFFGSGDSWGSALDADLLRWEADLRHAVEELRRRSSCPKMAAVGLRLGGSLCLRLAASGFSFDSLVLWNPLLRGARYLQELAIQQIAVERHKRTTPHEKALLQESLGFPIPAVLRTQLASMDLRAPLRLPARRLLIVESGEDKEGLRLAETLRSLSDEITFWRWPGTRVWLKDESKEHVPQNLLDAISGWLSVETK